MKKYLYRELFMGPEIGRLGRAIIVLICLSIASVVLESEITIYQGNEKFFFIVKYIFGILFSIEYFLMLYASGVEKRYRGIKGKVRYIFSFYSIVELIALVPFFIIPLANEFFLLRLVRIFRFFSLLKIGKHAESLLLIAGVVKSKRYELIFSFAITVGIIFFAAVLLYLSEGGIQPEHFGSIPRALWWASMTLTSIGYGDVVPVTVVGKFLTVVITVASIGIVALPTGILASGFSNALTEVKSQKDKA